MNFPEILQQADRYAAPVARLLDVYHVFTNTLGNCKYCFPWGKDANFLGGEYASNNVAELEHLMDEVRMGHPHLAYKGERNTPFLDPLEDVKKKAVADYLAEQARALDASKDGGSTEGGKLQGIANTATIAAAASGSTSGAVLAGAAVIGGVAPAATIMAGKSK